MLGMDKLLNNWKCLQQTAPNVLTCSYAGIDLYTITFMPHMVWVQRLLQDKSGLGMYHDNTSTNQAVLQNTARAIEDVIHAQNCALAPILVLEHGCATSRSTGICGSDTFGVGLPCEMGYYEFPLTEQEYKGLHNRQEYKGVRNKHT